MSNLRNKVQLIGHLGADPEVKNFDSGKKNVNIRLATNESYKVNNEWKEETQWHRLVAWDRIADRIEQNLQKGNFVLIEGKLTHRSYEDSKGESKYISQVQVNNFVLLDRKETENATTGGNKSGKETVEKDDLPI